MIMRYIDDCKIPNFYDKDNDNMDNVIKRNSDDNKYIS